jgi:hypothetical protein
MIATMPSIEVTSAGNRLELGWNFRRSESEVSGLDTLEAREERGKILLFQFNTYPIRHDRKRTDSPKNSRRRKEKVTATIVAGRRTHGVAVTNAILLRNMSMKRRCTLSERCGTGMGQFLRDLIGQFLHISTAEQFVKVRIALTDVHTNLV